MEGVYLVRGVHASGRQRDRRQRAQRGDGGVEGSGKPARVGDAPVVVGAVAAQPRLKRALRFRDLAAFYIADGAECALGGDGGGRGTVGAGGVGLRAAGIFCAARRQRDGVVVALSAGGRALRMDAGGVRRLCGIPELVDVLDVEPAILRVVSVFRRGRGAVCGGGAGACAVGEPAGTS